LSVQLTHGPAPAKRLGFVETPRFRAADSQQAQLTLLSGHIDARVRVYFAFFSKTWKKTIAKLKGYSPAPITFVEGDFHQPLVDLPSPLDALPQITFVTLPQVSAADFPNFNSWTIPPSDTPADRLGKLVDIRCTDTLQ
jgi:hypothetical protein